MALFEDLLRIMAKEVCPPSWSQAAVYRRLSDYTEESGGMDGPEQVNAEAGTDMIFTILQAPTDLADAVYDSHQVWECRLRLGNCLLSILAEDEPAKARGISDSEVLHIKMYGLGVAETRKRTL